MQRQASHGRGVLQVQHRVLDVASSKYNIADLKEAQGDLEEARSLFLECEQIYANVLGFFSQRALEVFLAVYGQEHPSVANSYYNLACLYAARDSTLCRDMLLKAEQTGQLYLLKEHMKTDSDMDPVRELEWYKDLAKILQRCLWPHLHHAVAHLLLFFE